MLNDFKTEGKLHAPAPVTLNQVRPKVTKAHVPNKYWASPFHDIYNQSSQTWQALPNSKVPLIFGYFSRKKRKAKAHPAFS